jgi:hypothetical protein
LEEARLPPIEKREEWGSLARDGPRVPHRGGSCWAIPRRAVECFGYRNQNLRE